MNLQNNKTKNFTPLPNEIFSLHLSTGELATYAVLMRLEDQRTYECWPSYETIGKSIGKSKSSAKRYVAGLVEKGLITVEPTSVIMRNGLKKKRQPVLSHSPHPRSGGVVHPAATVPRRSRRRTTSGTAETVGASHRTAAFAPVSRCVASQEGESVVGRRRLGTEHRAFGAMASFAFVVRFSAPGRNRSQMLMRAKPTPLFMEEQCMKKEEFIRIRVAGWQKKYISLQAEKAHKSLSQYVRDAAMDKDVTVIDGVDDLIRELRRQGNNLNQLVVMARQGHVELVNMEPFMEVYENTWQTLNSLLSRVG